MRIEWVDGLSHETGYRNKQTTEMRQSKRKVKERGAVLLALGATWRSLGANGKFKQVGGAGWEKKKDTEKKSRFKAENCWDWWKSHLLNQSETLPWVYTVHIYSWSPSKNSRNMSDHKNYDHKPSKQFCTSKYYQQSQGGEWCWKQGVYCLRVMTETFIAALQNSSIPQKQKRSDENWYIHCYPILI